MSCHKNKKSSCKANLRLSLASTITEDIPPIYDLATISDNGAWVWVMHSYPAPQPGIVAASLYSNAAGVLTLAGTVPFLTQFNDETTGFIANDGSFAVVIDEGATQGQVRVFSIPDLTLLRTIPLPGLDNPNFELVASPHLFLGRYTTATYPTSAGQNFVIALIDVVAGTVVATAPISGVSNDGGYVFELNGNIYVSIGSSPVDSQGNPLGPWVYDVFKLQGGFGSSLVLVEEIVLPARLNDQAVQIRPFSSGCLGKDRALIALSMNDTALTGVPIITGAIPSFPNPNNEPSGIWLLAFDGKDLSLTGIKTANSGTVGFRAMTFDRTGRFLLATIPQLGTSLSTLVTYRLEEGLDCDINLVHSLPHFSSPIYLQEIDVNLVTPVASGAQMVPGWLVVSGGAFATPDAPNYPEVNLFAVTEIGL